MEIPIYTHCIPWRIQFSTIDAIFNGNDFIWMCHVESMICKYTNAHTINLHIFSVDVSHAIIELKPPVKIQLFFSLSPPLLFFILLCGDPFWLIKLTKKIPYTHESLMHHCDIKRKASLKKLDILLSVLLYGTLISYYNFFYFHQMRKSVCMMVLVRWK